MGSGLGLGSGIGARGRVRARDRVRDLARDRVRARLVAPALRDQELILTRTRTRTLAVTLLRRRCATRNSLKSILPEPSRSTCAGLGRYREIYGDIRRYTEICGAVGVLPEPSRSTCAGVRVRVRVG